ncbi:MAG: D-alanine--D-alanine ligase [Coxiellaceae bacterium]|nr:D-alanine--D-alanine ligase [Coxiellaceae bacterium]
MKKSNVTVICGGPSVEHEVSVRSAQFICSALNPETYDVQVILITHEGHWYLLSDIEKFESHGLDKATVAKTATRVMPALGIDGADWVSIDGAKKWQTDVVIPVMHGTLGEDGSLQGIMRWLKLPFVGADVLGSALCMDKGLNKRVLHANGIPVADWQLVKAEEFAAFEADALIENLGLPLFIKPVDSGSSVGISKVHKAEELVPAIKLALQFSRVALIEEAIAGREIEIAVLGNHNPQISLPGEVIPSHEFYSYDAKYVDPDGAQLEIPADLPQFVIDELQAKAGTVYDLLQVEGLARIDFFVTEAHQVILNEVNTLPGFTEISMYPKMCEYVGVDKFTMMDRLIACAIERFEQRKKLVYRYEDLVVEEL